MNRRGRHGVDPRVGATDASGRATGARWGTRCHERRRGELDLVALAARRALDEAHRGERDVDQVELLGQRFDDAPEPVVAVGEEGFAQVGADDLGPALAQVGDGRQPCDLELRVRRRLDVRGASGVRAARPG